MRCPQKQGQVDTKILTLSKTVPFTSKTINRHKVKEIRIRLIRSVPKGNKGNVFKKIKSKNIEIEYQEYLRGYLLFVNIFSWTSWTLCPFIK